MSDHKFLKPKPTGEQTTSGGKFFKIPPRFDPGRKATFRWQREIDELHKRLVIRAGKMPLWTTLQLTKDLNHRNIRGRMVIEASIREAVIVRYPGRGLEILQEAEDLLENEATVDNNFLFPALIRQLYQSGGWRRYEGEFFSVEFKDFKSFVEGAPPAGLGTDIDTLMQLCEGDDGALGILRQFAAESEA